jgi:hypothetical protein
MKLPKFFRKLGSISIPIFLVSLFASGILGIVLINNLSGPLTVVMGVMLIVMGVSFVTMIGSIIAAPLARIIENAILRQFGEPASATVLETYDITSGSGPRGGQYLGTRFKLDVHPSRGGPFVGVAEDVLRGMTFIDAGDNVSVKYDPYTKEVALVMPKKMKIKTKENF